tara:strand:- start:197 stop:664 length:468 start_codon:yes stop_codon:yes gene_type:complete
MPTLLYFILFKGSIYNEILYSPLLISIILIVTSTILYNSASNEQCKKTDTTKAILQSFISSLIIFGLYYLLLYFEFMINPFIKLAEPFGFSEIGRRIGIGYYLMICNWAPFIIGYFNVIKDNCKLEKTVVNTYKENVWHNLNKKDTTVTKTVDVE